MNNIYGKALNSDMWIESSLSHYMWITWIMWVWWSANKGSMIISIRRYVSFLSWIFRVFPTHKDGPDYT